MKSKITTKQLVQIAVIAAIYAVLTAVFMSVSFTALQLRVSEVMVFLAYFNPLSIIGLTLGCFIANLLMSPTPLLEVGMVVASIWPVLFNAVIVGAMLCFAGIVPLEEGSKVATLIATMGSVGFGEMLVVMVMGIPLTYLLMTKYKKVITNYLG